MLGNAGRMARVLERSAFVILGAALSSIFGVLRRQCSSSCRAGAGAVAVAVTVADCSQATDGGEWSCF